MLSYIKKWIPDQRTGVLAGNSVHVDRAFLVEEMPEVTDWLHYRLFPFSDSFCKAMFTIPPFGRIVGE